MKVLIYRAVYNVFAEVDVPIQGNEKAAELIDHIEHVRNEFPYPPPKPEPEPGFHSDDEFGNEYDFSPEIDLQVDTKVAGHRVIMANIASSGYEYDTGGSGFLYIFGVGQEMADQLDQAFHEFNIEGLHIGRESSTYTVGWEKLSPAIEEVLSGNFFSKHQEITAASEQFKEGDRVRILASPLKVVGRNPGSHFFTGKTGIVHDLPYPHAYKRKLVFVRSDDGSHQTAYFYPTQLQKISEDIQRIADSIQ